ncbi:MAG: deoxyribose-phosphate aldolase [Candidatus Yanofskybacteria bacterium RIFCSPHIGHO2_01_FULL_41_27]|uniref:Deoxyribose-phosphate aldolase n=4 Tax=Parcubacteria group TaxID=1794811 RepID=A0A1F8HTH9_9BACT|nr:MAG: Deoxyribose-phosphate aldolase [Candidatus Jorgensenbacteria bacterium GW2011_GWF2_41_8]KKS25566.1 MAG: Deoxyribose-phosphate aldolase [Candidatus Yanofskybacteria bacterium GW2011_GWC2_41_9]OGM99766.1 MAG: deoxyribose-phosphate aldolase [Candidatus Yanofskybacteria bacterium RIFCSPHIGHO2_01_FULL_41_27]OGN19590.1 MAG: deoxyribose-phosphate aldolase [Candidatus Yanofskybacteria bacterium RIFCSPLOWO2_01_FULL_41_33]OGN40887.1 MAG: deoxyribose-phosphate aldolase [Candidatus Yanofskybacteria
MNIARYIDHTLLKPDATEKQIIALCEEAKEYGFYSVCVNPIWVSVCRKFLLDLPIKVCSVVGFPLGANLSLIKATETIWAIRDGADEIDMVPNIGELISGGFYSCQRDIEQVRRIVSKAVLKVIIETCLLTDEEKVKACRIAELAGADFVKTSTGFSSGGATVEDVRLMRKTVGNRLGVKAAGGIKTYKMAKAMIEAGANRLGCSNSVAIVREAMEAEKTDK